MTPIDKVLLFGPTVQYVVKGTDEDVIAHTSFRPERGEIVVLHDGRIATVQSVQYRLVPPLEGDEEGVAYCQVVLTLP